MIDDCFTLKLILVFKEENNFYSIERYSAEKNRVNIHSFKKLLLIQKVHKSMN
jgi:hypothetical protein